ncbi:(d)CMP kinase [Litoreibacter roseus]|uniref:Cytidylate kinase n=1 Tax=Litoreibacter roseus TaxID=2601869 RepID=A0A6N6JCM2_9RHOB|nr:d(CMP) kinase [Litoreibacter roseus]GFE63088.1 cytidylate kinase [Litoreibacter roseus]
MIFTVAIDGPAAAGKGTISKQVAARFGFAHLDTGLIYRATAARVLEGEDPLKAAGGLRPSDLERDDLRTPKVAQAASKVAAISEVREVLVAFQRSFATRDGGAVLDGRDIGTVICPDADVKLYVTASDAVRAKRRFAELSPKNPDLTEEGVLQDLMVRDKRDRERVTAPMRAAYDALQLDTSEMSIEQAVAAAISAIEEKLPQPQADL